MRTVELAAGLLHHSMQCSTSVRITTQAQDSYAVQHAIQYVAPHQHNTPYSTLQHSNMQYSTLQHSNQWSTALKKQDHIHSYTSDTQSHRYLLDCLQHKLATQHSRSSNSSSEQIHGRLSHHSNAGAAEFLQHFSIAHPIHCNNNGTAAESALQLFAYQSWQATA